MDFGSEYHRDLPFPQQFVPDQPSADLPGSDPLPGGCYDAVFISKQDVALHATAAEYMRFKYILANKIEDDIITLEVGSKTYIRVARSVISKDMTEAQNAPEKDSK